MRETRIAVVVSEEQGEVAKFRKWELDITPHRRLIKEGMELPESMRSKPQFRGRQRMAVDEAFKAEEHPFRIAIVCAMWLTGFDVPSLSTLYLDKPLKAHTLMQAIARANRVNEGKNNGLIVDYCGILRHLRKALATFAEYRGRSEAAAAAVVAAVKGSIPYRPGEELLAGLAEGDRAWCELFPRQRRCPARRRHPTRKASSATPPSWPARRPRTRTTRPASASR